MTCAKPPHTARPLVMGGSGLLQPTTRCTARRRCDRELGKLLNPPGTISSTSSSASAADFITADTPARPLSTDASHLSFLQRPAHPSIIAAAASYAAEPSKCQLTRPSSIFRHRLQTRSRPLIWARKFPLSILFRVLFHDVGTSPTAFALPAF